MRWTRLPSRVHTLVAETPDSVLLETSRCDAENWRSFAFLRAERVIAASSLDDVPELFRQIDEALAAGFHVAGYVGYECGYHFERFGFGAAPVAGELPLAWFGVYRTPVVFDHSRGCFDGDFVLAEQGSTVGELPGRFVDHVLSRSSGGRRRHCPELPDATG